MPGLIGRLVGLHIGYWKFDRWYRWAWYAWPQALAILLAISILGDGLPRPGRGKWNKPADCSNASNPGCAATRRAAFVFPDVVVNPTLGLQNTVAVDRSAFASSAAAHQPKLTAALAAYYGSQWQRAADILKSADASDPNVQLVSALALLGQGTMDSVHASEVRLRAASAAGQRQAGAVLGRILVIGAGGVPKDEQEGRKLIENGAAAGDAYALRLNAIAYLSREFGSYDPSKAADLMHKSAEAGDPFAMISYAMFLQNGLGGIRKNEEQSINYLRRAAASGSTGAQYLLGLWLSDRYKNREIDNPSESMKWYELAYQRGYSFFALVNLAHDLKVGRSPALVRYGAIVFAAPVVRAVCVRSLPCPFGRRLSAGKRHAPGFH